LQPERERLAETVKTIPFHTLALKVIEEEKSADREAARLSLKKMNEQHHRYAQQRQ